MNSSALKDLLPIWIILTTKRRLQVILVIPILIISSLLEVLTLGSIIPFLTTLNDPSNLYEQPLIQKYAVQFGFSSPNQLIQPFAIIFALSVILSTIFRIFNLWYNNRLSALLGYEISKKAYKNILYQPYSVQNSSNSSSSLTTLISQTGTIVVALNGGLQIITSLALTSAILAALLVLNPQITVTLILFFGTAYFLIAYKYNHEMQRNGEEIIRFNEKEVQLIQESLGSVRDIILDNNHEFFINTYAKADLKIRLLTSRNAFIGAFPRYLIEGLGLVLLSLVSISLIILNQDQVTIINTLGVFGLSAQRLLPAMQSVYLNWSVLRGCKAALKNISQIVSKSSSSHNLPFRYREINFNSLAFKRATFSYGEDSKHIIDDISLEIQRGECIGIVGQTGSGKSTFLDLLMGLLKPTLGLVEINNKDIHLPANTKLLNEWRSSIAHVPQSIYLTDSSIVNNIAFGIDSDQIDMRRVVLAARIAQIHNFITSTENSYETRVGERGNLLSGGQRQRIGIARALYKNAAILILDEATSALDLNTEKTLMDSIINQLSDLTIIMVAHRLASLRNCNRLIMIDCGKIKHYSNFNEVEAAKNTLNE